MIFQKVTAEHSSLGRRIWLISLSQMMEENSAAEPCLNICRNVVWLTCFVKSFGKNKLLQFKSQIGSSPLRPNNQKQNCQTKRKDRSLSSRDTTHLQETKKSVLDLSDHVNSPQQEKALLVIWYVQLQCQPTIHKVSGQDKVPCMPAPECWK